MMNRRQALGAAALAAFGGLAAACSGHSCKLPVLVGPFTDTSGHPYESYIEEIRLAGLTAGTQTDPPKYEPDRALTRGEAAVFLARVLKACGQ